MSRNTHSRISHEIIPTLGVVLVTLAIYAALYYASLTALRPYRKFMVNIIEKPPKCVCRPIVNGTTVAIFASSPFNAYEAVILHVNPWTYFLISVVAITIIFTSITLLHHMSTTLLSALGRQVRSPYARFTAYAMASAIALSYAVSAVVWLVLGAPSIGTSIYTEFLVVASVAVTIKIRKHLITAVQEANKLRHSRMTAVSIVLAIATTALLSGEVLLLIINIPLYTLPHLTGLLLSIPTTYLLTKKIN